MVSEYSGCNSDPKMSHQMAVVRYEPIVQNRSKHACQNNDSKFIWRSETNENTLISLQSQVHAHIDFKNARQLSHCQRRRQDRLTPLAAVALQLGKGRKVKHGYEKQYAKNVLPDDYHQSSGIRWVRTTVARLRSWSNVGTSV